MSRLFSSLRFQLIVIVMLSVLPAIALILYSGFEERKNAALQAQENRRKLVELASTHQARVIDEACSLLATLSASRLSHIADTEECSAYLLSVLTRNPHFLNLGIMGTDGKIRCSALSLEGHPDFTDRDYFQHALKEGGFAIGSSQFEPTTRKTSINFGYPLKDAEGRVRGVVFAAVDLAWLSDLAAYLKFSDGVTLTIVDREGVVIVRYPEPERWAGRVFPDTGVLRAFQEKGGPGTVEAEGMDGVRRMYAFTPLDDSTHSTILYTGVPTSTVYAEANRALARNLIALGLVTVIAILVAYLFGHLVIMRRVNALIRTAVRLAGGDLGARTGIPFGSSELKQLGIAFDVMAESLENKNVERDQMEAALRRSEAKYRTLLEQIPVVTYTAALDETRTILFISPQIESLLGFDSAEFCQDPHTWIKWIHQEDRERFLEEVSRSMKDNDRFICEYRMLTLHGLVKWIRDEATIVVSDSGDPLFIQGVLVDITEKKKFEEELVAARNELEIRVEQRTEALAKVNEDLLQSTEKLKSFAYSVMHDLKSPAIGVYGLTKLLRKQYVNSLDEKGIRHCNHIMKASEHIVELAEKINMFIATKETPLTIESVKVGEILKMLKEEFSVRLGSHSVGWFEPEAEIEVRADRLSLLRMFRNFVDNALKYGGDQLTEIRIEYQEWDNFHVFSVSDDGQGVRVEDAERIFQMFQRHVSSSGIEGAGLGLSIVREIAEKHGGSVSVKAGIEKGAIFSCSISRDL